MAIEIIEYDDLEWLCLPYRLWDDTHCQDFVEVEATLMTISRIAQSLKHNLPFGKLTVLYGKSPIE